MSVHDHFFDPGRVVIRGEEFVQLQNRLGEVTATPRPFEVGIEMDERPCVFGAVAEPFDDLQRPHPVRLAQAGAIGEVE